MEEILERRKAYHAFLKEHPDITKQLSAAENWNKLTLTEQNKLTKLKKKLAKRWGEHTVDADSDEMSLPTQSDLVFNLQTMIASIIRRTIGNEIKRLDIDYRERMLEEVKKNPEHTEGYWLDRDLLKKAVKQVPASILPEFYDYMRVFEDSITDPEYREKFIETLDELTDSLYFS